MAGGRRPGAGHPTEHERSVKRDSLASAAAIEQRVLHSRYEKFLEAAAYWAEGEKATGCLRCRKLLVDCKCHKPDKGEIWLRPPDKGMVQFCIEKVGGKAAAQPQHIPDTTIQLIHNVPRPEPAEVPRVEDAENPL